MSAVSGKSITECFAFASRVGVEIEGLMNTLSDKLVASLKQASLPCKVADKPKWDSQDDPEGWICKDSAFSIPLKGADKGPTERYVRVQVSVAGEGIAIPKNEGPVLLVSFWEAPYDFDDQVATYFPMSETDDMPFSVVSQRQLLWIEKNEPKWNEQKWTFSLRLTELNSADDLQNYVIDPVLALLNGAHAKDVLPDVWFETVLIRYPDKQQLLPLA